MITGTRSKRYWDAASRELKSGMVREPQWSEALRQTGGDPDLAAKAYIFTRVAEFSEEEQEHESAASRLRSLRSFNDSLAPFAPGKGMLLILVILATLLAGWFLMR